MILGQDPKHNSQKQALPFVGDFDDDDGAAGATQSDPEVLDVVSQNEDFEIS